jgi:Zn finger protein HypA/HybF involved in hydrogenase expression
MFVNVACPKCGGHAIEYDEKKWSCPFCGNKFVLADNPSHTFVQTNVQIQGHASFELDVAKAKPPLPRMVKMIEHDPNYIGKSIADNDLKLSIYQRQASRNKLIKNLSLIICLLMWLFGGFVLIPLLNGPNRSDSLNFILAINGLVLLGVLSPILLFAFFYCRKEVSNGSLMIQKFRQTISSLNQQNLMDTRIGDYILCPHCEATLDYFPLNSPPPLEGLRHCLKCGKQFFTKGLHSYPILPNK